jgi:Glycosyl transferase family 90
MIDQQQFQSFTAMRQRLFCWLLFGWLVIAAFLALQKNSISSSSSSLVFRRLVTTSENNSIHISSTSNNNNLPINQEEVWNEISDNFDTTTTTTTTTGTITIHDYIDATTKCKDQMVLLKWNSSGTLENMTGHNLEVHNDWISQFLDGDFLYTTQSQHGKVALIYVWDTIEYIPFDITPPIPVIVYSIWKERYMSTNYILGSNPYDQVGFSEWQVTKLLQKFNETMINTTYETFNQRKNTLMWRGKDHGEPVRKLLLDYVLEEDTKVWIDAKASDGHDATALSEEELASMYKYHLDVGGVSGTSWEGLRWKMCSGNLVFHVELGAMDWWYPSIQGGVHYLAINNDLSNLKEQYDWTETHPYEAYEIAQRGQQACLQSYMRVIAQEFAINMIHALPDSTIEQIQEADQIFEEYYSLLNDYGNIKEDGKL